jgi:hypothetical protein
MPAAQSENSVSAPRTAFRSSLLEEVGLPDEQISQELFDEPVAPGLPSPGPCLGAPSDPDDVIASDQGFRSRSCPG